jgi:predicted nucleotidyltransferase
MASLATTTLTDAERRAVAHLVAALERELGDELHAVWLYGSRARGEPPRDEDSDVDVLVVTSRAERDTPQLVRRVAKEAADAEGLHPYLGLSVFVTTPEWVWKRRAIEAFYIQEVDRDKIVLAGGEVAAPPDFEWHESEGGVRRRTREHFQMARTHQRVARLALDADAPGPAVVAAYAIYGPPDLEEPWIHETPESARQAVDAAESFLRAIEELAGA